ncbi:hypothetical protein [Planctomyces sp. SH-PL62]|uniref:hypothetical protein n=1 Tax=Planctomyces sp. SH-PL62 TaxID=1636152 RepID=UPI00078C13CA|nr:hypothetical protein [Planctomyces sp. SH-PL62]AMV39904.1 hypothetical protein VT85_20900 [Planctomyces sp. SH-PL62]
MTTPRSSLSAFRLAPLLASLIVCAAFSPRSSADCAHRAGATVPHRASAALQLLELGASPHATTWTVPGLPCHGPRCKSKAPSAETPSPTALPDRDDGCLALFKAPPPAPAATTAAWAEPLLSPILAALALERPPRGA